MINKERHPQREVESTLRLMAKRVQTYVDTCISITQKFYTPTHIHVFQSYSKKNKMNLIHPTKLLGAASGTLHCKFETPRQDSL